jgi:pimeloyl-ACP methyl ester carboxylesterase
MWLALFIAVPTLALAAGALYQWMGARRDRALYPPPGRRLDIGGAKLHIREMGAGAPTVVLEAGIAGSCLSWSLVQPEVARFAKVCSYDRAGLGWSDAISGPRTPPRLVEELRALLKAAGVQPPYVLVGHSFGGLIIRAFAARYPSEVAGLVMVDPLDPAEWRPLTPDKRATLTRGLRLSRHGRLLAHVGVVRLSIALVAKGSALVPRLAARISAGGGATLTDRLSGEIRKLPREAWPLVANHWRQPKCYAAMTHHLDALPAGLDEIIAAPPVNTPTILITGARSAGSANVRAADISSNLTHIIAAHSGHWVQLDEPAVVIEAIRALVEQAAVSLMR